MIDTEVITDRFQAALNYAARKHAAHRRKASDIPYLSHLLAVCSILMEYSIDEDVWIAGLLHDAVEDQGGEATALEIESLFGHHVGKMVRECSEMTSDANGNRPPWLDRKLAYMQSLADKDANVLLISLADKLHNARSILKDWLLCGNDAYCKFTAGRNGTHWYYHEMIDCYRKSGKVPEQLLSELEKTVAQFAPVRISMNEIEHEPKHG